jgi:hypothetical protein
MQHNGKRNPGICRWPARAKHKSVCQGSANIIAHAWPTPAAFLFVCPTGGGRAIIGSQPSVEEGIAEMLNINMCLISSIFEEAGCRRNQAFCSHFKTFINCGFPASEKKNFDVAEPYF